MLIEDGHRRLRGVKDHLLHLSFFADLVVLARSLYPIPSRTRPSKSSAPMVLSLKTWKSRSLPGLQRTDVLFTVSNKSPAVFRGAFLLGHPCISGSQKHSAFGSYGRAKIVCKAT